MPLRMGIIRELPSLKENINNANNKVCNNPENKKKNRPIDVAVLMLFKNMILLKDFILDPLQTANKIMTVHGDLPYSKDFKEYYTAINCAHTKNQGVELGKDKIISNIKKIAEEIVSKYKPLAVIVKEPLDSIDKTLQLVESSFDSVAINRRWNQATENIAFTNYTLTNVDRIFAPEAIHVNPAISLMNFLRLCGNIYPSNFKVTLGYVSVELDNLYKDIVGKLEYINANNKYLKTTQFNKTKICYEDIKPEILFYGLDSKEDFYKEVFRREFEGLPQDDEVTKQDTIFKLVSSTEQVKSDILLELNKIKEIYGKLASIDFGIEGIVGEIVNNVVLPLGSLTITTDEYDQLLEGYKLVMHNLLSVYDHSLQLVEGTMNASTNAYYVSDRIYKLLDKLLLKSTMEKGKEKQTNKINYDTTQQEG